MSYPAQMTLTDYLLPFRQGEELRTIEAFRIEYEKTGPKPDLSRRFTSQLTPETQEFLLRVAPAQYFQGLPPFYKAYVVREIEAARSQGKLDGINPALLNLFVRGDLRLDDESPSRGR